MKGSGCYGSRHESSSRVRSAPDRARRRGRLLPPCCFREKKAATISKRGPVNVHANESRDFVQCVRQKKIVAVEPAKNVASAPFKTFVQRRRLGTVGARLPMRECVLVAADNLGAAVVAASVHDNVFKVRTALAWLNDGVTTVIFGRGSLICVARIARAGPRCLPASNVRPQRETRRPARAGAARITAQPIRRAQYQARCTPRLREE